MDYGETRNRQNSREGKKGRRRKEKQHETNEVAVLFAFTGRPDWVTLPMSSRVFNANRSDSREDYTSLSHLLLSQI
uniref:Transposase n=1 Tax=Heterorhabditis bacteriophora TaxID=37862 RepID=A0A1I7WCK2_HETBA